ncbi:MAG TPA: hypothetical protein PKM88_10485 [bacterium]|nr:hypothetical protein [bacterium]
MNANQLTSLLGNQDNVYTYVQDLLQGKAGTDALSVTDSDALAGVMDELAAADISEVSYERYELDYSSVKLIERGITGENRKAAGSSLSAEAINLSYEQLSFTASSKDANGDTVAATYTFTMTSMEYESLNAEFNGQASADTVNQFLDQFEQAFGAGAAAPVHTRGGNTAAQGNDAEDGLTGKQRQQLNELRMLLKTFTNRSDQDIDRTIGSLRDMFASMNGNGGTAAESATASLAASSASAASFSSATVQVQVTLYASGRMEMQQVADPLVIDLDGDGVELTDEDSGAVFDLTGDGTAEQAGTITGDDAFLTLDRNGNGSIDGGKELFGDQHGAANGFDELKKFDDNGDGRIDAQDAVFAQLQLWTDRNADGASGTGELRGLSAAGIAAIDLNYQTYNIRGEKSELGEAAAVTFTDGRVHAAADVRISYQA